MAKVQQPAPVAREVLNNPEEQRITKSILDGRNALMGESLPSVNTGIFDSNSHLSIGGRSGFADLKDISNYTKGFNWDMSHNVLVAAMGNDQKSSERGMRAVGNIAVSTLTGIGDFVSEVRMFVNPIYQGYMTYNALFKGDSYMEQLLNNPMSKFFREIREDHMANHKVYQRTQDFNPNQSVWDEVTSSTFLGNEGAESIGFALSALIPSIGIEFLSGGTATPLVAANMAKFGLYLDKILKGKKLLTVGQKGYTAAKTLGKFGKFSGKVVGYSALQTAQEASMEAAMLFKEVEDSLKLRMENGELNPLTGEPYTEDEIYSLASSAMWDSYWINSAQLFVSNTISTSILFGPLTGKGILNTGKKLAASGKVGKAARTIGIGLELGAIEAVSEAVLEEGPQTATEKYLKDRALGETEHKNMLATYGEIIGLYASRMSYDKDIQKGMLLGGMLGGIMGGTIGGVRTNYGARKQFSEYTKIANELGGVTKSFWDSVLSVDEATGKLKIDYSKVIDNADKTKESLTRQFKLMQRLSELSAAQIKTDGTVHEIILEELISQTAPYLKNQDLFDMVFKNITDNMDKISEFLDENSPLKTPEVKQLMQDVLKGIKSDIEDFRYVPDLVKIDDEALADLHSKETFDLDTKEKRKEFLERHVDMIVVLRAKINYFNKLAEQYESKAKDVTDPNVKKSIENKAAKFREYSQKHSDVYAEVNTNKGHAQAYMEFLSLKTTGQETVAKIYQNKLLKNLSGRLRKFVEENHGSEQVNGVENRFLFSAEFQLDGATVPTAFQGGSWMISKRQDSSAQVRVTRVHNGERQVAFLEEDGDLVIETGQGKAARLKNASFVRTKTKEEVFAEMQNKARVGVLASLTDALTETTNSLKADIKTITEKETQTTQDKQELNQLETTLQSIEDKLSKLASAKEEELPINFEKYEEIVNEISEKIEEFSAKRSELVKTHNELLDEYNKLEASDTGSKEAKIAELKKLKDDINAIEKEMIDLNTELLQNMQSVSAFIGNLIEEYKEYAAEIENTDVFEFQEFSLTPHSVEHLNIDKLLQDAGEGLNFLNSDNRKLPFLEDWMSFLRTAISEGFESSDQSKAMTNFLHSIVFQEELSKYDFVAIGANEAVEGLINPEDLQKVMFYHNGELQTYAQLKAKGELEAVNDFKIIALNKGTNTIATFQDELVFFSLPEGLTYGKDAKYAGKERFRNQEEIEDGGLFYNEQYEEFKNHLKTNKSEPVIKLNVSNYSPGAFDGKVDYNKTTPVKEAIPNADEVIDTADAVNQSVIYVHTPEKGTADETSFLHPGMAYLFYKNKYWALKPKNVLASDALNIFEMVKLWASGTLAVSDITNITQYLNDLVHVKSSEDKDIKPYSFYPVTVPKNPTKLIHFNLGGKKFTSEQLLSGEPEIQEAFVDFLTANKKYHIYNKRINSSHVNVKVEDGKLVVTQLSNSEFLKQHLNNFETLMPKEIANKTGKKGQVGNSGIMDGTYKNPSLSFSTTEFTPVAKPKPVEESKPKAKAKSQTTSTTESKSDEIQKGDTVMFSGPRAKAKYTVTSINSDGTFNIESSNGKVYESQDPTKLKKVDPEKVDKIEAAKKAKKEKDGQQPILSASSELEFISGDEVLDLSKVEESMLEEAIAVHEYEAVHPITDQVSKKFVYEKKDKILYDKNNKSLDPEAFGATFVKKYDKKAPNTDAKTFVETKPRNKKVDASNKNITTTDPQTIQLEVDGTIADTRVVNVLNKTGDVIEENVLISYDATGKILAVVKITDEGYTPVLQNLIGETNNSKKVKNLGYKFQDAAPFSLTNEEDVAFDEGLAFFEETFPEMELEIALNALIEGVGYGQLTSAKKVMISSLANGGVFFHEGFHVANLVYNTKKQREAIYNEMRRKYANDKFSLRYEGRGVEVKLDPNGTTLGKDLENFQIEEFLAEEFRKYMFYEGNYVLPESATETKSFFKRLYNAMINFINKLFGIQTTEDFFETIKNSNFTGKKNDSIEFSRFQIRSLPIVDSLAAIESFNVQFFSNLYKLSSKEEYALANLEENFPKVYNETIKYFKENTNLSDNQISDLKRDHLKYLKRNQITINESLLDGIDVNELEKEIEEAGKKYNQFDRSLMTLFEKMPKELKILFMGIASEAFNTSIDALKTTENLVLKREHQYMKLATIIHNELAGKPESAMIGALVRLSKSMRGNSEMYDWVGESLLPRLGFTKDGKINSSTLNVDTLQIQHKFFSRFTSQTNEFEQVGLNENGEIVMFTGLEKRTANEIVTEWKNNTLQSKIFDEGKMNAASVTLRQMGLNWSGETKSKMLDLTVAEFLASFNTDKYNKVKLSIADLIEFLEAFGFSVVKSKKRKERNRVISQFSQGPINDSSVYQFINRFLKEQVLKNALKADAGVKVSEALAEEMKKKDPVIEFNSEVMFNDKTIRAQKELKALRDDIIKHNNLLNSDEGTLTVADGTRRQAVQDPSFASEVVGVINNTIEEGNFEKLSEIGLVPYGIEGNSGNPLLDLPEIKDLFTKSEKDTITLDQYVTAKDADGEVNNIDELTESLRFLTVFQGYYNIKHLGKGMKQFRQNLPIIRTGNRAIENFIRYPYNLNLKSNIDKFTNLFYNEVASAILIRSGLVKTGFKNIQKNGDKLMYFDGKLGSKINVEELLSDVTERLKQRNTAADGNLLNNFNITEVTKELVKEHLQTRLKTEQFLIDAIETSLQNDAQQLLNHLIDIGVFVEIPQKLKKDPNEAETQYELKGINSEVIQSDVFNLGSALEIEEDDKSGNITVKLLSQEAALNFAYQVYGDLTYGIALTTRMLGVNPHMFANLNEVVKRMGMLNSTKTQVALMNTELNKQMDKLLPRLDGKIRSNTTSVSKLTIEENIISEELFADVQASVNSSQTLNKAENKRLADTIKKAYSQSARQKGADGQSMVTLDHARDLIFATAVNSWSKGKEMIYQYEQQKFILHFVEKNKSLAEDKKYKLNGEIINEKLFKKLFKEHVKGLKSITQPVFQGEVLNINDFKNESINNIKAQGVSPMVSQGPITYVGLELEKSSYALLWPSEAILSGHEDSLLELMNNKIDVVGPPSSKKGEVSRTASTFKLTESGQQIEPQRIYDVPMFSYGIQLSTEAKNKPQVSKSSQMDNMLFYDLVTKKQNGFTDAKKDTFKKLYDEYYKLNRQMIDTATDTLLSELGLVRSKTTGDYEIRSSSALVEKMRELFEKGDISQNLLNQVEEVLGAEEVYFDMLPNKDDIVSKIIGFFRNDVIKFQVKGESFVQESSVVWGYDKSLKFYRIEDGVTQAMQVRMTLNWSDYEKLMTAFGSLDNLNSQLKKGKPDLDTLRYITGNRIPSDNTHSMDFMEVVEFLPPWTGQKIVLPPQVVVKSGTDFDIDKLTTYLNNFKIENGKLKEIVYYEKFNNAAEEQLASDMKALLKVSNKLRADGKITEEQFNKFEEQLTTINNIKSELKRYNSQVLSEKYLDAISDNTNISDAEFEKLLKDVNFESIASDATYIIGLRKELKRLTGSFGIDVIKQVRIHYKNNPELFNTREALENRQNQIRFEVLSSEEVYGKLIAPTDTTELKETAKELRGDKQDFENYSQFFNITESLKLTDKLMMVAKLVGIKATDISFRSKVGSIGLAANNNMIYDVFSSMYDTIDFHSVRNEKGDLISGTNGELLNGSIDIEKDFSILYLNINSKSSGLLGVLTSLGTEGQKGRKPMTLKTAVLRILTHPAVINFYKMKMRGSGVTQGTYQSILDELGLEYTEYEYAETLPYLYKELKRLQLKKKSGEDLTEGIEDIDKKIEELESKLRSRVQYIRGINSIKLNTKNTNDSRLKSDDGYKATLEIAMYYDAIADEITSIAINNRQDSGIPKSLAGIQLAIENHGVARKEAISTNADTMFTEGTNAPYLEAYEKIDGFISKYMFTQKYEINQAIDRIAKKVQLRGDAGEMLMSNLQSYAITYALMKSRDPETGIKLEDEIESLVTGEDSVASQLRQLKESNPAYFKDVNKFFKEFLPVLNEFVERRNSKRGYDYIKVQPRSRNSAELDEMADYATDYARSNYEEYDKINTLLQKLAVIQFAFVRKRISYASLLEGGSFQGFIQERLSSYLKDNRGVDWEGFEEFVFKNQWYNTKMVPKVSKTFKTKNGYRERINEEGELRIISYDKAIRGFNGPPPYVSVAVSSIKGNVAKKLIKEGKSVPTETVLYAYVNTESKVKMVKGEKVVQTTHVYQPTDKRGDAHLFETKESIIAENSLEYASEIVGSKVVKSAVSTYKVAMGEQTDIEAELKLLNFNRLKPLLSKLFDRGFGYRFYEQQIPQGIYAIDKAGMQSVLVKVGPSITYKSDSMTAAMKEELASIYGYESTEELEADAKEYKALKPKERLKSKKFTSKTDLMNFVLGQPSKKPRFFQQVVLINNQQIPDVMKSEEFIKNPEFQTNTKLDNENLKELYETGKTTEIRNNLLQSPLHFIKATFKNQSGKSFDGGIHARITDSKVIPLNNEIAVAELLKDYEVTYEATEGFTKVGEAYYKIPDGKLKKTIENAKGVLYQFSFEKIETPLQANVLSFNQVKALENEFTKMKRDGITSITLPTEFEVEQKMEIC